MCKTNYPKLEDMVNDLAGITEIGANGRFQRVKQLQKICDTLLKEYEVKIGGLTIEPLRLEAYYYHPGQFEDPSVHKKDPQKTFAFLYPHKEGETELEGKGIGGVDICLSCGGYYLSFLIKNSRINGDLLCKQIKLNEEVNKELKKIGLEARKAGNVLHPKDPREQGDPRIFHTMRVNLGGKPYAKELLASVKEIEINNRPDYQSPNPAFFDWATGFGTENMIAEYLCEHPDEDAKTAWKTWWKGGIPGWVKKEWEDKKPSDLFFFSPAK